MTRDFGTLEKGFSKTEGESFVVLNEALNNIQVIKSLQIGLQSVPT